MRLGSEIPRLWTRPLRDLTPKTSRGFEVIHFAEEILGVTLFPWQRWLLIHLLEMNPDGSYRFRTAVVLVARQNGKTTLLSILFLWRIYVDQSRLVIGTSTTLETAEETWAMAVEMAEADPELASEIEDVIKVNGKKALVLTGKRRYKVATASRRGGRGLSGDFIGLDELREHRSWDAWAAVSKTTMARAEAQIIGWSNAGDAQSVVLNHLHERALSEVDDTLGVFEWSAEPDCAVDDRDQWAQSNPSLGYGITERAIQSAMGTDPEEVFRTEVLCQRVDDMTPPVIPASEWAAHCQADSQIVGTPIFALDVSPKRDWACLVAAGVTDSGGAQIEITAAEVDGEWVLDYRPGTSWVVSRLAEVTERWGNRRVVLTGKAAGALRPALESAGIEVVDLAPGEYAQACGAFFDAATWGDLIHLGQPELSVALVAARRKNQGDDTFCWDRRRPAGDITPLVAGTVALWGLAAGLAQAEVSVWSLSDVEQEASDAR